MKERSKQERENKLQVQCIKFYSRFIQCDKIKLRPKAIATNVIRKSALSVELEEVTFTGVALSVGAAVG